MRLLYTFLLLAGCAATSYSAPQDTVKTKFSNGTDVVFFKKYNSSWVCLTDSVFARTGDRLNKCDAVLPKYEELNAKYILLHKEDSLLALNLREQRLKMDTIILMKDSSIAVQAKLIADKDAFIEKSIQQLAQADQDKYMYGAIGLSIGTVATLILSVVLGK